MESGWRLQDCSAELHVVMRRATRAGWTFGRMLHAYSALDHATRRARAVRRWPDGDIPGASAATNAKWSELRAFAASVLAGNEADPTPRAWHWCSKRIRGDHERAERAIKAGRLRRVHASVPLFNDYFAEIG